MERSNFDLSVQLPLFGGNMEIYNCLCSPHDGRYQILQNENHGDGSKQIGRAESFSDSLENKCAFHGAVKRT